MTGVTALARPGSFMSSTPPWPQIDAPERFFLDRGPFTGEAFSSPDMPGLNDFYVLLQRTFRRGELESFQRIREELASNEGDPPKRMFLGVILRSGERVNAGPALGGVYGSVQEGVLALRFKVTLPEWRGSGMSQVIDSLFAGIVRGVAAKQGQPLWACVGECVNASEGYFNRVWGLRRVYRPGPAPGTLQEMHYELPHIGPWSSDGKAVDPEPAPIREHLQIAFLDGGDVVAPSRVREALTAVWQSWYLRPRRAFRDDDSWRRHADTVMRATLEDRILAPLDGIPELTLLSRDQREKRVRMGETVVEMD